MQAAVVGDDHRVAETRADDRVGLRYALRQQPARTDLAALLLVVGQVQLDRALQGRAGFHQREQGEGVGGKIGLRHGDAAAEHLAIGDLGAIGIMGPARAGRDHVAMGVQRDRRAGADAMAHHEIGRRDHASGARDSLGHGVPLDGEAELLQQLGRAGGVGRAIAGRIVRGNLHQFGEEPRLFVEARAHERAQFGFDIAHVQLSVMRAFSAASASPAGRGVPSPAFP